MATVNIDDFLNKKIAIRCSTKENAEEFINFLLLKNVHWFDEQGYEEKDCRWGLYKERTAYIFLCGIQSYDVSLLSALGFKIFEYKSFSKEDLDINVCTPEELQNFILGNSDFIHT